MLENTGEMMKKNEETRKQLRELFNNDNIEVLTYNDPVKGTTGILIQIVPTPHSLEDIKKASESGKKLEPQEIKEVLIERQVYPKAEHILYHNAEHFVNDVDVAKESGELVIECDDPNKLITGYVCVQGTKSRWLHIKSLTLIKSG